MTWPTTGTKPVRRASKMDIRTHRFLMALDPELAQKLTVRARQRGVSTETLINVWLTEKLESGS